MKKVLLLLLISVFLSACTQIEVFDFEGESDNWKVIYTAEILDEQIEQTKLKLQYVGEKPIPEEVSYIIETNSGKMEGDTSLDDKGVLEIAGHGSFCSNCAFSYVYKNENVKATISWKENSEELKLNNDVTVE